MPKYTDQLEQKSQSIITEEENCTQDLEEAVNLFRSFDEYITLFITEQGYTGEINDIEEKALFIQEKFKTAKIKPPRGIKGWFSEHKTIERGTAFQLAFAFGLSIEETHEFFKRLCIGRCFDCHTAQEAIFYCCIKNGFSYSDADEIISKITTDNKNKIPQNAEEIIYTTDILRELDSVNSKSELLNYINENLWQFSYNNATAAKYVKQLWAEIACENGLAYKDGILKSHSSLWSIYIHILGLDKYEHEGISANIDRSIAPILRDNKLLHPLAAASFPDREGINRILNGEHLSYDRIRKLLILLLFYRFWEKKAVKKGSYDADYGDNQRCAAEINKYLLETGYSELYCGNPYDWIFLWAMEGNSPLEDFRFFMGELYSAKLEEK